LFKDLSFVLLAIVHFFIFYFLNFMGLGISEASIFGKWRKNSLFIYLMVCNDMEDFCPVLNIDLNISNSLIENPPCLLFCKKKENKIILRKMLNM
jgi:hypothetical protein